MEDKESSDTAHEGVSIPHSTKSSPKIVREKKLPREYQPEILRAAENAPFLGRVVMYAVGLEAGDGTGFGLTHGPFSNLDMALEMVPGTDQEQEPPRWFDTDARVVRFNQDESMTVLYEWKTDRWMLKEGVS